MRRFNYIIIILLILVVAAPVFAKDNPSLLQSGWSPVPAQSPYYCLHCPFRLFRWEFIWFSCLGWEWGPRYH